MINHVAPLIEVSFLKRFTIYADYKFINIPLTNALIVMESYRV